MYRDGAELHSSSFSFFNKEWWLSRRYFWERKLTDIPHCVVFVFDGSSDPFLDSESLEFFQSVFEDCKKMGMSTALLLILIFIKTPLYTSIPTS